MYQSENYGFDRDEVEIGITDYCIELRYYNNLILLTFKSKNTQDE